jgi:hypothetical protein
MTKAQRFSLVIIGILFISASSDVSVLAQGTSSTYRIDESYMGQGSSLESSSAGYRLEEGHQSTGAITATGSSSSLFSYVAGATTQEPTLSCILDTASIDFGNFSTALTSTANATFSVLNYTSYGYNVRLIGGAPKASDYSLSSLSSGDVSRVGVEQFGINLVANTSPANFGSFPEQVLGSEFSSGDATTNYSIPNIYRYVEGESIAAATQSSGRTNYTISYIINVETYTPGGVYTAEQVILCTGTY